MSEQRPQPEPTPQRRIATGIAALDDSLGGGLLPGSLTMILGATGVGKTQLAIRFANPPSPEPAGAFIDLSSRGDSQNHDGYTKRIADRELTFVPKDAELPTFASTRPADVLPFFGYSGRRVMRSQMDTDQWHGWQSEINRRMPQMYRFVYGHLIHGTRRFVVDGIEPQDDASDSIQLDLLELIYHRMLRQEHDWLAREVLREHFREHSDRVEQLAYNHDESACVVLVTTKLNMLDQLVTTPLADGDLAAGANTVIMMGRTQSEKGLGRALYIAKHRGSYANQDYLPFSIDDEGLQF